MQIAILTVSSLALAVGVANLLVMGKTASELKKAKMHVDEVAEKAAKNVRILKSALTEMEL